MASSQINGGNVYLDEDILKLMDRNKFEKTSNKMIASLDEDKIDWFVEILQEKFNDSVSLNASQYEVTQKDIP